MKLNFNISNTLPEDAKNIRNTVFVQEQGFENEYDSTDGTATHIVAYCNETAVGVCRVFSDDETEGVYLLGRLAVLKVHRGKGIGAAIVAEAEKYVKQNGGAVLKLHSQTGATAFYEKLGYEQFGSVEYEENCPHIWMKKNI